MASQSAGWRNRPYPSAPPTVQTWEAWPEVTVRLRSVPGDITARDIHNNFSKFGEIVYIELFESPRPAGKTEARFRLEPPPKESFWASGFFQLKWGGEKRSTAMIRIELEPPRQAFPGTLRSKVDPNFFYPAKMTLNIDALDFGPYIGPQMMVKETIRATSEGPMPLPIKLVANFQRRQIAIFFSMALRTVLDNVPGEVPDIRKDFKVLIDFSQILNIYFDDKAAQDDRLTIPLRLPPAYHYKDTYAEENSWVQGTRNQWTDADRWVRCTGIFDNADMSQDFSIGLLNRWDSNFIDIGRWTTFRVHFAKGNDQTLDNFFRALADVNIQASELTDVASELPDRPCLLPHDNYPVRRKDLYSKRLSTGDAHGLSLLADHDSEASIPALPFEVQYQLEVCISHGVFSEFMLTRGFFLRLLGMDTFRAKYLLEFCSDMSKYIDDPLTIFDNEEALNYYPSLIIPRHCAVVRKVLVTPTTMHFSSPAVESSNRVLRHWYHLQDRFLRVQFVDELHSGRIKSLDNISLSVGVYKRIFHTMVNGIRIGDRHYKFLAFGNSQIRECGAWFFCETSSDDCETMRKWMGDFKSIKIVAKCAARIGQCFSTTRQIQGISTPHIARIDDIEQNGYCFTDGVGKISSFLASVIVHEMGVELKETPTAFQFRMGGCKGVLAVWPGVNMKEVQIRKSQQKFEAKFNGLEIIRLARFSSACLNRQVIAILTSLGVPARVFVDMASKQLVNYERAMRDRAAAATLLGIHVDENQTALKLRNLINWGFMNPEVQEPFVMTILQLWRSWSMKLLKEKARINVDKGALVIGCVDETGTLRGHSKASEGKSRSRDVHLLPQIFLQIPDPRYPGAYKPVTGVCLVGRNPSLHPGDVRVVEAIDCPVLRHLRNVVVFPSIGDRDVPSMLGGGDLDGDDFFVLWEPSLIPPEWNHPPMDYHQEKPVELKRPVNHHDLAVFFVKYIQNDCLPAIALSHLASADDLPGGAKNAKCIRLAALHSKAVDFVKTGDPATLTKDLRARKWPHYMGRTRNSYHSTTALGQIYDRVHGVSFQPLYQNKFDERVLEKQTLGDKEMQKVRQLKSEYDIAMRRLMAQREISTEFEVWSGYILSKPRVGNGYKMAEEVGRESSMLQQHFRELMHKEAGGSSIDILSPWVVAMYKVTEEELKIALFRHRQHQQDADLNVHYGNSWKDMPFISFPWIFHEQLGYIATGHWQRNIYVDLTMGTEETLDVVDVEDFDGTPQIMMAVKGYDVKRPDASSLNLTQQDLSTLDLGTDEGGNINAGDPELQSVEINKSELAELDAVRLPDGTFIHRGQVLHLFDEESEEDDDQGEEAVDNEPLSDGGADGEKNDADDGDIWDRFDRL